MCSFSIYAQAEARDLAQQQPALLTLAPATLRSTLSAVGMRTGASLADCISMLVEDPGSYVLMGYSDDVISAWSERLQLDPQSVLQLLQSQPALLDITANTVKARLETLAALFGVPLEIAVQLALKHAALAAVPPNATITRVKNLSTALQMSMQVRHPTLACVDRRPALLCDIVGHAYEPRVTAQSGFRPQCVYTCGPVTALMEFTSAPGVCVISSVIKKSI